MDAVATKQMLRLAKDIQSLCPPATGPEDSSVKSLFDYLVTESEIRNCCCQLYEHGHFARAVEEAFKCLNNYVKDKARSTDDGSSLMRTAFSPNNPKLKLNRLKTKSDKDEQLGYMEIYSGCMTGIRNPRAHEHEHKDDPEVALELITWANHLMRRARQARRGK